MRDDRGQAGFTLIELLVVMLVMAILMGIALPLFLSHREKSHDARSKSDARNLVVQMEDCGIAQQGDFTTCDQAAIVALNTGLPLGTGVGEVEVTAAADGEFEIRAHSPSGREYVIVRNAGGLTRSCEAESGTCAW